MLNCEAGKARVPAPPIDRFLEKPDWDKLERIRGAVERIYRQRGPHSLPKSSIIYSVLVIYFGIFCISEEGASRTWHTTLALWEEEVEEEGAGGTS